MFRKRRKNLFVYTALAVTVLLVLGSGYRYYAKEISATRIAFVNYPEFQLSRIHKSGQNGWIQIDVLPVEQAEKARNYAAVFIFGRGFQMSPEQMQAFQHAGYSGTRLFVESATNPNVDVTNLKGEELDRVTDYLRHGGTENYGNLLAYVRRVMDGKSWFSPEPGAPKPIPRDVFIHLDESEVFETFGEYERYLKSSGNYREGRPRIALLTSVPGPFNANRDHIDALIQSLENRDLNVFTISASTKRLGFLKQTDPDLVILMPHGRLTLGQADEAIAWLKEKNIPVLSPLSVFQPYDEWLNDPQGFSGPLLSMSVVLPELDGGIVPYAMIAQYEDEAGYLTFRAIPERLDKFGDMVEKWLALKQKPNREKKIAIYYFKGSGLNAMTAANMEVVPSLFNTLRRLKAEGYAVENLPESEDELWQMILRQGAVLGPYAKGAFDEFLKDGDPALVEKEVYEQWVNKDLKDSSYEAVVEKYGPAPGEYMSFYEEEREYIAVARLQFGNVVLLPQPMPGLGEDTYRLVHGADTAPPHPYIASYLWTRHAFRADAVIHWGTHGSLEFTPGKQVALSGYDWTDALIGTTPHFYVYTISNVGEGIIAKRRSYATTLTYLTPPFMEGETHNELDELRGRLTDFVNSTGVVREQYRQTITELAFRLDLDKDLSLETEGLLDDESIFRLSNYVEEIAHEKVTGGLYTLGNPYTEEEIIHTVALMALDPVAYSLAALDKQKGNVTQQQLDNQLFFDERYRTPSKKAIADILENGESPEQVLHRLVSPEDLEKAEVWQQTTRGVSDSDIIRGFIGMASGNEGGNRQAGDTGDLSEQELEELQQLVVSVSASPEKRAFVENLTSDKQFRQASGMLDPQTLERAKTVAKAVPAMAEALDVGQEPDVFALLKLMQKEPLRQKTFELLADESLAERIAEEKRKKEQEIKNQLREPEYITALKRVNDRDALQNLDKTALQALAGRLDFYRTNWPLVQDTGHEVLSRYSADKKFPEKLDETISTIQTRLADIERGEREFATAVLRVRQAVLSVPDYKASLETSTEAELEAILTGLNGGYIAPSSGGDPITNAATVPTGRNLYSVDAEKTPSPEGWETGRQLADNLLRHHLHKHGKYPEKVSFTLWSGDFIETGGATLAEIFYLLGVEPVRDPFNRVVDLRLIPEEELGRPRIDVVVQTSGQFRDLAASRISLINKAVRMASEARDETENFVAAGVRAAEDFMKEKGLSPKEAREWSAQRVFGGVNGSYGTNIMELVEKGDRWDDEEEVAETYLNNMGAIYDEGGNWGTFREGVFEAALQYTDVVVQPRAGNTWGGLSLDHVYEFMGGLSLAVRHATGSDPDAYFNDLRNPVNARVQGLREALWTEARSTLLNPNYIGEYMKGGATSAETFAETFRNAYGWNVMKPEDVDNALWDNLHDVYVRDELNLNIQSFFKEKNPYALQEMTAVMLETVRKGYWQATPQQIGELARLHTELIRDHEAGCSGFVCDNPKLQEFIEGAIDDGLKAEYTRALAAAKESAASESGESLLLEKEVIAADDRQPTENGSISNLTVYGIVGLFGILIVLFVIKRRYM